MRQASLFLGIRLIKQRRLSVMRKCIRCGAEMQEGCTIKVEGAGYGVVLSTEENKIFGGRVGKPRVAICPECGEVSIYLEDVSKLQS